MVPTHSRPLLRWLVAGGATGLVITLSLAAVAFAWLRPTGPAAASPPPMLVEQAAEAGIEHVYDGDFTFFVGGGVAVFDCNDDGRPDLYLAGGTAPAALYRNESPTGGVLRFAPVPSPATGLTDVTGAYPIDIDSDAITDLVVLRIGENLVLRGTGNCGFERANEDWQIAGGDQWTTAFSATWEAGQVMPTLAFGNYLVLDDQGDSTGACADNALFRPDGSSYGEPSPLVPGWCTLSILFYDWNHSGRSDLRMANDRHYYRDGEEQLWQVEPGESPRMYTEADGWQKMQIWGMGIATYDVTGDGLPEVFLTSQGDNKLQSLVDGATGPDYSDIAIRRGVTAHRPYTGGDVMPSTAWHPEFEDVNNDGYIDLFVTKGNVEAMPDFATKDPSNLLVGQPDGSFVEGGEEAGIAGFPRGRGAALADFNLDGLLDLIQVNRRENVELWRNVGAGVGTETTGHWLALRLRQPAPNVDAIGAWVEVEFGDRSALRQVTIGGGHAGGQLGWIHFGLGDATETKVRVRWPDGETGPWTTVEPDRFAVIARMEPQVTYWEPTQD